MGSEGLMVSFAFPKEEECRTGSSSYALKADTGAYKGWMKVVPFGLAILPPSSGVQFYRDGIVFLSSSKFENRITFNQISFGKTEARYAVLKDSILEKKEIFSPSSSFQYPCDGITFSTDYNTMYFTRFSKDRGVEKIFQAKFSESEGRNGFWIFDDNPVSFCTGGSIDTHPALSADGKFMIFASDRSGSVGGLDLFVSENIGGTWSEAVNLGDAVNSKGNELYPFLDQDNNLYYSSDGIQGYGGFDIYICKFKDKTWEKPINLSAPVNTRFDDIAFTLDRKEGKTAFYTVKENSGKRSLSMQKITMNSKVPDPMLTLSQFFTRPDVSRMVILALEPPVQATDKNTAPPDPAIPVSTGQKENIVYRVQFLASFNPWTRADITIDGKVYSVFEYLYSGAYRLCAGEFGAFSSAVEFRNTFRKSGYPQAFVVAFKNNIRTTDPELLK